MASLERDWEGQSCSDVAFRFSSLLVLSSGRPACFLGLPSANKR